MIIVELVHNETVQTQWVVRVGRKWLDFFDLYLFSVKPVKENSLSPH